MFSPCFVIQYFYHLDAEVGASCFTLIVFLMSCDCKFPVALPLCAMGWSAVCDCGIS